VDQIHEAITRRLADQCLYLEQGKSAAAGTRRQLFDRMRKDAALRKFERGSCQEGDPARPRHAPRDHNIVRTGGPRHHDRAPEAPDRAVNTAMGRLPWVINAVVFGDGKLRAQ